MGWKLLHKFLKYQFLMIFLATGVSFISLSQNWELYGSPIREIRREIEQLFGQESIHFQEEAPGTTEGNDPGSADKGAYDSVGSGFSDAAQNPVEDITPSTQGENNPEGSEMLPWGAVDQGEGENGALPVGAEEKTFQTVDEKYFEDALFIGDSRTVGLRDYGKLGDGPAFYASKGLTIFKLFTAEIVEQEGKKKNITVEEALGQKQFRKIYLMVGINELGTGDVERFEKAYREAVEHIRELQPDAIIYIQSILKVTEERSRQGDYITNQGIIDRNEAIRKIADNQTIFYLDVNEAVCDESGCLKPEYSGDGVHITAKYIYLWKDYLMSHAIEM